MLVVLITICGDCIYLLKFPLYLNIDAFESNKYISLLFIKDKLEVVGTGTKIDDYL